MKNEHIVMILLLVIIGGASLGYVNLRNGSITTNPNAQPQTTGVPYQVPTQTQTPSTTVSPDAQLYFEVTDAIGYADVASTTYVDVAKAQNGVFNLLQLFDTKAQAANPQAMNSMVQDGSQLIIHIGSTVTPTNGAGYYDGWYYMTVHVGNPIYQLKFGDFALAGNSPSYTYTISATSIQSDPIVGYVSWTSGTTPYWNLGKLYIFPRVKPLDLTETVSYQSTALASVSDGATWVNYTTTTCTANATLASTQENLVLSVYSNASNLGYGFPMFILGSNGAINDFKTYVVFTTSMLSIGTPSEWTPLTDSTLYAEKGFYKPIGPFFAPKGASVRFSITIPIDSSNAPKSTKYRFAFWIIDIQNPNSLPSGTMSTTMPSAYGFIYQYGPTTMVQPYKYTTGSGSSATFQLYTYLTTPA
jgi:hypothetical protein